MFMINVWPLLIIAVLVVSAMPKEKTDPVEDKGYPHTPKKVKPNSQELSKKALRKTFTQTLLESPPAQQILKNTMASQLIQGMVQGTLPDDQYRNFLIEDARHLLNGQMVLSSTATTIKEKFPEYANMYNIQAEKYDESYKSVLRELNMENVADVPGNLATRSYQEWLSKLAEEHPRLLVFGFLPCSQSFRFMSNELLTQIKDRKYEKFFQTYYRQPGYESQLEKFINDRAEQMIFEKEGIKTQDAESIYLTGMKNEDTFIENAASRL